jgi:putative ABC transport system permease protein
MTTRAHGVHASRVRIPVVLAWRNATRHRGRFAATAVGVALAVFLVVFQGSLLVGFIKAAGKVIDVSGGDAWIVPHGVPSFDFAARIPRSYLDLAWQVDGVRDVLPMVAGFTTFVRPDGRRRAILLVGAERRVGARFPRPMVPAPPTYYVPDGVAIDATSLDILGLTTLPVTVEIAGHRVEVVRAVTGFGSFLGSPYVFGTLDHARRVLRFAPDEVSFGVVRFDQTPDARQVEALRRRLPHADVMVASEFARQSASFWLVQTGAGGAILVAALLGLTVGLVIVLQTMYANTVESLAEFATLKAIGAPAGSIRLFIAAQASCIGGLGACAGLIVLDPLTELARRYLVTWIDTPLWLRAAGALAGVLVCLVAALVASRTALRVDPMQVLRS